jgi:hypothetical protein
MDGPSMFISSCSRRQLARRRPTRMAFRSQLFIAVLVLAAGFAAFVIGRGGI